MEFGVDPPWYNDPIERLAFNLFAISLEENEERRIVSKAIKKLSNREQTIIKLRFGLNGEEEKTQKEVADLLGISQSYISRLEKKIIKRLKKEIEAKI